MAKQTIELFCGTKSFSKVAKRKGYKTFTVDIEAKFKPSICIDILNLDPKTLPQKPFILWASPPCTAFSVASIYHYWKNGRPKSYKTYIGLAIIKKTLEIIEEIKPTYWFIENPRGMMRNQEFMKRLPKRNTVTYCQYGFNVQKPTDIFTNCLLWNNNKTCEAGANCHESAKRGSDNGTQNQNRDPEKRAIIPPLLFEEIFNSIENPTEEQKTL